MTIRTLWLGEPPEGTRMVRAAITGLLLVTTACAGTGTPADPVSPTRTATDVCADASLAFWGLEGPATEIWQPDALRLGYTLSGDALLVAFEDGAVLAWRHVGVESGRTITADGDVLQLERPLSGEHTIRVVLYRDLDDDRTFDPDVDEPCRPVTQAGPRTIDFDRFTDGDPTGSDGS